MIKVLSLIGNIEYDGNVVSIVDGWVALKETKVTFMFHTSNAVVKILWIDPEWKRLL